MWFYFVRKIKNGEWFQERIEEGKGDKLGSSSEKKGKKNTQSKI